MPLLCRDAYLICLIDSFTSAFAGFVIFAILGVMANEANTSVENVVEASMFIYIIRGRLFYTYYTYAFVANPLGVLTERL